MLLLSFTVHETYLRDISLANKCCVVCLLCVKQGKEEDRSIGGGRGTCSVLCVYVSICVMVTVIAINLITKTIFKNNRELCTISVTMLFCLYVGMCNSVCLSLSHVLGGGLFSTSLRRR